MDTPPPLYPPPLPPPSSRLRVGPIVRDVAILWGLTLIGGFIIGFLTAALHPGARPSVGILAVANLGLMLIAFTLAGSLVPPAVRWKHLAVVALFAWLSGLVNVFFLHMAFLIWVFSAFFVVLPMVLGGALSYLFNRDPGPTV